MDCKIIEFLGTPGCGKSTLSELLTKSFLKDGLKVCNLSYEIDRKKNIFRIFFKQKFILIFIIKYPLLSLYYFNYVKKSNQNSFKDLVKTLANLLYILALYEKIEKTTKYDYIIFDQGLIQAIWSVLISSNNQKNSLPDKLPLHKINHVLRIVASDNEILNRLNKRDGIHSRIENLPAFEMLQQIESYERTFDTLIKYFQINPIVVHNEKFDQINQNIELLKTCIITQ